MKGGKFKLENLIIKNRKKKALFCMCIIFLMSILNIAPVFAEQVAVSLPTFNVTMNGVKIENAYRQYPFIVYKDITYFPMTYFDSRFLNLETKWDSKTGLEIYEMVNGTKDTNYEPYVQEQKNLSKYTATIPTFTIKVNGKSINNSKEKYPLLIFRNVTYFPMTWRFGVEEFGWEYTFTSKDGLRINSLGPSNPTAPVENTTYPIVVNKAFELGNDKINIQIRHFRTPFPGNLYLSINNESFRQLGNLNYVYGVTAKKDSTGISMQSNDYVELKDKWLFVNAFNLNEENESKIYKINIETGEIFIAQ